MENEYLKGHKILIVEDDLSSKLYLNKILEKTGAVLYNAGDGQEAVDLVIKHTDIEIILMDIQLPVMDGYMATESIRNMRDDIIIIAQTAYGLLGDREKFSISGFDDYIIKPIMSQALIEKLVINLKRKKQ
ncbi:MAG: response regulator [Bacteroidales bacterium]|nr:response regulator [Bacteroidales bacterium]MBK7627758.1 response regulator [Bacteroidales bacterium]